MLRAADFVKVVVAPFVLDDFKQFFVSISASVPVVDGGESGNGLRGCLQVSL